MQPALANEAIILRVAADPEPEATIWDLDRERTVVRADAHRAEPTNRLEVQGRMARVLLEEREVLVGEGAGVGGESVVERPELRRRVVDQRGRECPARCCARAASARESSARSGRQAMLVRELAALRRRRACAASRPLATRAAAGTRDEQARHDRRAGDADRRERRARRTRPEKKNHGGWQWCSLSRSRGPNETGFCCAATDQWPS